MHVAACNAGMPVSVSRGLDLIMAVQVAEVVAEEWVQSIRNSYRPSRVADGLWIIPDWCAASLPLQRSCSCMRQHTICSQIAGNIAILCLALQCII